MLARNHEASGFAVVTLVAAASGVPAPGAVLLGLLGAWSGDWPDIDHEGATVTTSLKWVPYRVEFVRDKTGDYKRRKDGRYVKKVRYFPSWQVHRFFCWLSAWIWDRCATPADRRDTNPKWGPAFRVHRGFTHSLWCALLGGAAWWLLATVVGAAVGAPWEALAPLFGTVHLPWLIGCTVVVGMCTHVAGDACTDFGVAGAGLAPLLKVQGRRYWHSGLWEPMRFKVSKSVETVIIGPLMGLFVIYAVLGALFGPDRVLETAGQFVASLWTAAA